MEFFQVTYTSVMEEDKGDMINDIVKAAQKFNNSVDISGYLTYDDDSRKVFQMFVGKASVAKALWARIQADQRHMINPDSVCAKMTNVKADVPWGMAWINIEQYKKYQLGDTDEKNLAFPPIPDDDDYEPKEKDAQGDDVVNE